MNLNRLARIFLMNNKNLKISIIIVNYKTPDLLEKCLGIIKKQANLIKLDYEIIIIDNSKINRGYAKAVNLGIRKSNKNSKYLLIITPDIFLQKNALKKMLKFMNQNLDTGLCGPQLLWPNKKLQESYFYFYKPWTILYRRTLLGRLPWGKKHLNWFLMRDIDIRKNPKAPDWIKGCAMLVRRNALNEVGLMDNRFFMYFEDVDWCKRFKNKSYKIAIVHNAQALHFHHSAQKGGIFHILKKQNIIHIKSAIKYFWKWGLK